ncbi:hypothetical protein HDU97_004381 [Phlyctochytrium planicorne]|nr:hypothetical protein HDU97_004381 [Phlyctochytrium planicorne]
MDPSSVVTFTCLRLHPSEPASTFPITIPISSPVSHLRSLIAFQLNVTPAIVSVHAVQLFLQPSDPSIEVARKGGRVDAVLGTIELKEGDVGTIRVWGKGGVDVVAATEELPDYDNLAIGAGDGSSEAGGSQDGTLFGAGGSVAKQVFYNDNGQRLSAPQGPSTLPFIQAVDPTPVLSQSVNPGLNSDNYTSPPTIHAPIQPFTQFPFIAEEKKKRTKRWIWIMMGSVILIVVLGAGIGLGVTLGNKKDRGDGTQGPNPAAASTVSSASTGTAASTAIPSSTVAPAAGTLLKSYSLFNTAITASNPISTDTFFACEDSPEHGFKEISVTTGAVVTAFKGPYHKSNVWGLSANKDSVFSADGAYISKWDFNGTLKDVYPLPSGNDTNRFTVRFMGSFTSLDVEGWSLVVVNDYYSGLAAGRTSGFLGYVAIIPSAGVPFLLPDFTGTYSPWCGVILSSTSFLIGTSEGLVTRWMAIAPKSRLLYTAGLDSVVKAWNLDSLPLLSSSSDAEEALATYSGFGNGLSVVSISDDESTIAGGDALGNFQVFSRPASATAGIPPSTKATWTRNVGFEIWHVLYLAGSNSWFVGGKTSNPVLLAN